MTPRARPAGASARGSVTLWTLGLVLVVLTFGGIAVDLWRALAVRQQLVAVADAAAIAGASAIDVERWRIDGELLLDPREAYARADEQVARAAIAGAVVTIGSSPREIVVELVRPVPLTILRPVVGDRGIVVRGQGRAEPRLGG